MKKNYSFSKLFLAIICSLSFNLYSQTSAAYQLYLDANNNCNYDGGEQLLYNVPVNLNFNYVNTFAVLASTIQPAYCGWPLVVISPSVPATNTVTMSSSSPSFSYNSSCPAFTNLSYTATNYLPIQNINPMGNVYFGYVGTGYYSGDSTGNVFPVCYNIGNDVIDLSFTIYNAYTCNSNMASRTYSLYFDGNLYDIITASGTGPAVYNGSLTTINEASYPLTTQLYIQTKLGSGISTVGSHTWAIQSSQIYVSSLSAISYSCTLNSMVCSKVSGNFYVDCNSNCLKDPGDIPMGYAAFAQIFQTVGGFSVNAYPDANGYYSAYLPISSNPYLITSYSATPSFTPCSSTTYTIPSTVNTSTLDFGYITSNYYDVSVFCQPAGPSAVGGSTYFKLTYCLNNQLTCLPLPVNPGKVKLLVPTNFTYTAPAFSTPSPNTVIPGPSGDTLVWNISDFNSMTGCVSYYVLVAISPTVTAGQQYCINAFVNPLLDHVALNNQSTFCWYVGMPYDPNNKISYATGIQTNGDIPLSTTDLFYVVNFQNVGTGPAVDVKTVDTLDVNLDWTTLQVLSSSDPVQTQVDFTSGQTIFYFQNINLPDSNTNEPASHGFVYYKIKLKTGLAVNTIIKNRAHNYFDFQPAVATNQTKNKLVNLTGIDEIEKTNLVYFAPNPVTDKTTIYSKEIIQSVSVFNNLGQLILKQEVNAIQLQIDLSQVTDGIYFVSLQFKDGGKTIRKVVKN